MIVVFYALFTTGKTCEPMTKIRNATRRKAGLMSSDSDAGKGGSWFSRVEVVVLLACLALGPSQLLG
jgi:hypothetical protein